ncbi:MAG TPA: 2-phosphosulfolactate phosphatase [Bacteroidales bacterium]|nr:2-phosphosulfolactate phosphatase [Bacteroidales bacterium]
MKIEVCFTPATFGSFKNKDAVVAVIDVLRASSAICAAFMNGAEKLIPVGEIEEARRYKHEGYLVAAERDGFVLDFADFGNSPFNFTPERVQKHTIAYSTTNGTQAIRMASECHNVSVAAFINLTASCKYLMSFNRDIILFCAGWKNRFSLEDTVLAGAMTEIILRNKEFHTICDSALASLDLWSLAKPNLLGYIEKAAQRSRLRNNCLDDCIEFCHTPDLTNIVPVYDEGFLTGKTIV